MMLLMANFLVIGTWNTKGEELEFGWSGVGARGGQYYGAELVEALREQMLKYRDAESIIDVDLPLDDPRFARFASERLFGLMQKKWKM